MPFVVAVERMQMVHFGKLHIEVVVVAPELVGMLERCEMDVVGKSCKEMYELVEMCKEMDKKEEDRNLGEHLTA